MADTPMPNESDPAELRRQVEELRAQLAKSRAEAEENRRSVYALLDRLYPYTPPTDEELYDMMHGPRGPSMTEILDEFKRHLADEAP